MTAPQPGDRIRVSFDAVYAGPPLRGEEGFYGGFYRTEGDPDCVRWMIPIHADIEVVPTDGVA